MDLLIARTIVVVITITAATALAWREKKGWGWLIFFAIIVGIS